MPKIVKPVYVDDYTDKPIEDESTVNVVWIRIVKKNADGEPGEGIESTEYELYLADTSVDALDKALKPFVDQAEIRLPSAPAQKSAYMRNKEAGIIREWWTALSADERKSLELPDPPESGKGKMPDSVTTAYEKTHAK